MPDYQYGIATAEQVAGLSGLEMLEAMIAGRLPGPPIAKTLHFWLSEVSHGAAVFEGRPGPDLLNPLGIVHGGWTLALIDSATGCAVHSTLPAGVGFTTIETKVNMTRAIRHDGPVVRVEGRVVSRGRQIATAEARILSPEGELLAHGTSTLMILYPR